MTALKLLYHLQNRYIYNSTKQCSKFGVKKKCPDQSSVYKNKTKTNSIKLVGPPSAIISLRVRARMCVGTFSPLHRCFSYKLKNEFDTFHMHVYIIFFMVVAFFLPSNVFISFLLTNDYLVVPNILFTERFQRRKKSKQPKLKIKKKSKPK